MKLAFQCEQWGSLPLAGGILDQPAGLLERMSAALNVYHAVTSWRDRKPGHEKEWKADHPRAWETIEAINELRKADGKHHRDNPIREG